MSRIESDPTPPAVPIGITPSHLIGHRYENKEYLLKTIMRQLGMTEEDLERDPSWVKAQVREANIDKVLGAGD